MARLAPIPWCRLAPFLVASVALAWIPISSWPEPVVIGAHRISARLGQVLWVTWSPGVLVPLLTLGWIVALLLLLRRGRDVRWSWLPVAVTLLAVVVIVILSPDYHNADTRTYHAAGRAWLQGLGPYTPGVLAQVAGREVPPYVYPPATLPAAGLAALLAPGVLFKVWVVSKLIIALALIELWRVKLFPRANLLLYYGTLLFGFGVAGFVADMSAGNVGTIEVALVWLGLVLALEERQTAGPLRRSLGPGLSIGLAATIKVGPLAWLALLPAAGTLGAAALGAGVFAAAQAGSLVLQPEYHGPFLAAVTSVAGDSPVTNPSLLSLCRQFGPGPAQPGPWQSLGWPLYPAVAVGMLAIAGTVTVLLPGLRANRRLLVLYWALTLVLLLPRLKLYQLAYLVPPTFAAIQAVLRGGSGHAPPGWGRLAAGGALLAGTTWIAPATAIWLVPGAAKLVCYWPLTTSLAIWLAWPYLLLDGQLDRV